MNHGRREHHGLWSGPVNVGAHRASRTPSITQRRPTAIVMFLLDTGARQGELADLQCGRARSASLAEHAGARLMAESTRSARQGATFRPTASCTGGDAAGYAGRR
jgi:hypothetical protein